MKKKRNVFNVTLDEEEKKLLESVEAGEWESVDNLPKEITFAQEAAENFLHEDKGMTSHHSD